MTPVNLDCRCGRCGTLLWLHDPGTEVITADGHLEHPLRCEDGRLAILPHGDPSWDGFLARVPQLVRHLVKDGAAKRTSGLPARSGADAVRADAADAQQGGTDGTDDGADGSGQERRNRKPD